MSSLYGCRESTDTSSLLLFAAIGLLTEKGSLGYLLPESVLNIATFQTFRRLLLSNTILEIKDYGKPFDKIQSKAYSIIIQATPPSPKHKVRCIGSKEYLRLQSWFYSNLKHILNVWVTQSEQKVITRLLEIPHISLKELADWGLVL